MPTIDGRKMVSETVVRGQREARIVFTVEIRAGQEAWDRKQRWQSQAIDLLRDSVIVRALEYVLRSAAIQVLVPRDFYVLETKVEISK